MNKKAVLLVLSMSLLLLAGGCNKKNDLGDSNTAVTPSPGATEGTNPEAQEEAVNTIVKEEYNLEDYITLGKYKGVEISVDKLEVTEDALNNAILSDLQSNGGSMVEVTDRAVEKGDTVNIDFEGLKDGVAFEGGTSTGYDLTIGSNAFIPGFEDQLIGTKAGEKKDVNLTFPDNYGAEDLAGQDVVFKVTVNKIQKYELTEDYVKNNTSYDSMDAYKEAKKEELRVSNESAMKTSKENSVFNAIAEGSEMTFPQNTVDFYAEDYKVFYNNYAVAYGMSLKDFLAATGKSEESFEAEAVSYGEAMAKRELVFGAISKAENIVISEEEYQEMLPSYATQYGFANTEALLEKTDVKILKEDMLFKKVMDFVVAEAVEL